MENHNTEGITLKHIPVSSSREDVIHKEDIFKIYVGKGHGCRCGCEGDYFYPSDEGFNTVLDEFMTLSWKSKIISDEFNDERWFELHSDRGEDRVITVYTKIQ